jgi:hypothetical protein
MAAAELELKSPTSFFKGEVWKGGSEEKPICKLNIRG